MDRDLRGPSRTPPVAITTAIRSTRLFVGTFSQIYSQLKNEVVLSLITIPLASISGLAYMALSATV